jgi:hypothetical protein
LLIEGRETASTDERGLEAAVRVLLGFLWWVKRVHLGLNARWWWWENKRALGVEGG